MICLNEFAPPDSRLGAVVVVPARNEQALISKCLGALALQAEVKPQEYEVVVVLDDCEDGTARAVQNAGLRWPELGLLTVTGPASGAGPARATGMDLACARLEAVGQMGGLIATTDADSTVAADWIARQLDALAGGAEAVGGNVLLDPVGARELPTGVIEGRDRRLRQRLVRAALRGPAEHAHFAGASIGITPSAYREVGGVRWLAALEDRDLEDRLAAAGIPIHRLKPISVTTSVRIEGRAEQGLAADLAKAVSE